MPWKMWFALLAMLFATTAPAAPSLEAHAEAGRAFEALRAAHPEAMPRLTDADAASVLRTLADAPRFLNDIHYTLADLGALSELCDRDRSAIVAYIAFDAIQQGQLVPDAMARNAATWQDEIALLQTFQAQCIARQVPLAETLLKQIGEAQALRLRLGGLQRSQAALLQTYVVVAGHCPIETPEGSAYCRVLDVMADLAPIHARALPPASRVAVTNLLTPLVVRASGPKKRSLRRILDAMASPHCAGLCLLQSP